MRDFLNQCSGFVTLFICSSLALVAPAFAKEFNAKTHPVLGQTAEQLSVLVSKGTREKDGKRMIMTAHLSFPVERTVLLALKFEENSANTKITAEKDLVTGESKVFLNVQQVLNGGPRTPTMLMFDRETPTPVQLVEISRTQSFVSGTWQQSCSKFTGCHHYRTADYYQQNYVWRSELPIATLRDFVKRDGKANDRLIFWVGSQLDKASKQARKTSAGNYLLFRNQAKAVLDALEIAPL